MKKEKTASVFNRLTFYEYILLYWNYSESPYIKGLIREGQTPPNPERFKDKSRSIKKYAKFFPQCLLTEITGAKIDTLLGAIKKDRAYFRCPCHKAVSIYRKPPTER
jgi:hypothetical protein